MCQPDSLSGYSIDINDFFFFMIVTPNERYPNRTNLKDL